MKACNNCGEELLKRPQEWPARFAAREFCNRSCATRARGVNPVTTRYRHIKVGGRAYQEHRWVMQNAIGRPLRSDEFVHHKNGNKLDNRPENLEVLDPVTHGREHHLILPLRKPCVVCGREFTPHKTKRRRAKGCGPECREALRRRPRTSKKERDVVA